MFSARLTLLPAIFALSGFVSPTCLGALRLALIDHPAASADAAVLDGNSLAGPTTSGKGHNAQHRIVVDRSPDGLFYLTARINGAPVRFLVDTGSSSLVLALRDAAAARIDSAVMASRAVMNTAGGPTPIRWLRLESLKVGQHQVHDVQAAVVQSGLPVSLMGQSVLSQLGSITINGDQLVVD